MNGTAKIKLKTTNMFNIKDEIYKYESCVVRINKKGSGFWINNDTIITCYHVIKDLGESIDYSYKNEDGQFKDYKANVVYIDKELDIAILKVNLSECENKLLIIPFNDDCEIGDKLTAFGYPVEYPQGKVSPYDYAGLANKEERIYITFRNGTVFPGASGSPIINERTKQICGILVSSRDIHTNYNAVEGYALSSTNISQVLTQQDIIFYQENIVYESNFIKLLGKDVEPEHLLGRRSFPQHGFNPNFYKHRKMVDDVLLKNSEDFNNTIITGKSLAGKSRAIFNMISNHFPESNIIILKEANQTNESLIQEIDKKLKKINEKVFFVINDLDEYISLFGFDDLLNFLTQKRNFSILATCKTAKLTFLDEKFSRHEAYFRIVNIPPINAKIKSEIKSYIKEISDSLIIDNTIGSYFFPAKYMEKRYDNLALEAKEFLRSYKCLDIFASEDKGNIKKIKKYTELRLKNYYRQSNWELFKKEVDEIIVELTSEGFLSKNNSSLNIKVEPVYVEKIIAKNESEEKMIHEIVEYYPDNKTYGKVIAKVSDDKLAWDIFKMLRNSEIKIADPYPYTGLVYRSKNYNEAKKTFKQLLEREEFQPNTISINTLISKSDSFEEAMDAFKLFEQLSIKTDEATFYTLLNKTNDLLDLEYVKTEIEKTESNIPIIVYNKMINMSTNYDTSYSIYLNLLKRNMTPTDATFYSFLKSIKGSDQLMYLVSEGVKYDAIVFDEQFINSCFSKIEKDDFEGNLAFYKYLDKNRHNITSNGLACLLESAPDYETAFSLFNELKQEYNNFQPTVFNQLIKQANTFEEAICILDLMKTHKIEPTKNTYNTLLNKTKKYEQSLKIYNDIFVIGICKPDLNTFGMLIKSSDSFENAMNHFNEIFKFGLNPNSIIYNELINKTKNETEILGLIEIILSTNIELERNDRVLWNIISKIRKFELAFFIYKKFEEKNYSLNPTIFNALLSRTKEYDQALTVFNEIKKHFSIPSRKNYSLLIHRCNNLDDCWGIYADMIKDNHTPDCITFSNMLEKASAKYQADEIFEEAIARGAISNTYSTDKKYLAKFIRLYLKWIKKFDKKMETYNIFRQSGGDANIEILNTIINKCYDKDFNYVLDLIDAEGLQYDDFTFSCLIRNSKTIEDAYSYLKDMSASNLEPSTFTLNAVIKKAQNYVEAINIFRGLFDKYNLLPDRYTIYFISRYTKNTMACFENIAEYYNVQIDDSFKIKNEADATQVFLNWLLNKLECEKEKK